MTKEHDEGFLSRWSRKKLESPELEPSSEENTPQSLTTEIDEQQVEPEDQIPAESEDNSPPPIWQQAEADPELKKQALRALFRQPEFGQRDRLNEYDDDFTQFASLGDVVTHEMKRMLQLAQDKQNTELTDIPAETSQTDIEQNEVDEQHPDQEDDQLV